MPSSSPNQPLHYLSKKQLFHTREWLKKARPVYLKSCQFFGATLIDRTQTLDAGIAFDIIDPLPTNIYTTLSFEEICHKRAKELVEKTQPHTLTVLWSGGIDSTVALISLIQALEEQEELHRLKVLLSRESIAEFPSFFREKIKGKLTTVPIIGNIFESIQPKEIIVTGEHGDQLFGSDKLKYSIITGEAFRPYEDVLEFIISRKLGTDRYTTQIIDFINPQLKASPLTIVTLYDYLWWMNISLKWQTVSMRLIHGLERSAHDLEETVFHFFKNTDFQQWSFSNPTAKIKETWPSYKYIAKEFIYRFHPDKDYLEKKEKEQSLREVIVYDEPPSILQYPRHLVRKAFYFGRKI